ncbi:uncharacterized protein LOC143235012 [Tachypleus tridentatus]|uniref:uncharacterized protein LOC143235012 n=1 Tax=Tachypleus tridentatus TaxID=6853 RepID=UPI003FD68329
MLGKSSESYKMQVYTMHKSRVMAFGAFIFLFFLTAWMFIAVQQNPVEYNMKTEDMRAKPYFPRKLKKTEIRYDFSGVPPFSLQQKEHETRTNEDLIHQNKFGEIPISKQGASNNNITKNNMLENSVHARLHKTRRETQSVDDLKSKHQQSVSTLGTRDGPQNEHGKKLFLMTQNCAESAQTELRSDNDKRDKWHNPLFNTDATKRMPHEENLNEQKRWFDSITRIFNIFNVRSSTTNSFSSKDKSLGLPKLHSGPNALSSFSYSTQLAMEVPKFQIPFKAPSRQPRTSVTVDTIDEMPIVEDDIFWSEEIETGVPKGVTDNEVWTFIHRIRNLEVVKVEPPTWNRCGRPKNQYVTFQDGSRVCARYRAPHEYLVQGELLSFYLSRLLGIHNVPAVTLSAPDVGQQWKNLNVSKILLRSGWTLNSTIALIQWIDYLERERMPEILIRALENREVISWKSPELRKLRKTQLVELAQWSDLIIFDYVTGNYDRVASMQDAADRERKPSILRETIHNLVKSRKTSAIWLIDNESGLLDSYSLLYGGANGINEESRFISFHKDMLSTMCIFRKSTTNHLFWLYRQQLPYSILLEFIKKFEPLFVRLPSVYLNKEFYRHFHERLREVFSYIKNSKSHWVIC